LIGFFERYRSIAARIERHQINGQPGLLAFDADGRLINVIAFDISDGVIQTVRSMLNPDELRHLAYPLADAARADASGSSSADRVALSQERPPAGLGREY